MSISTRLPILWLAGAPGAGKSATAWHLFAESVGSAVGYVDIDQLGMVFPEPEGDPDRERTKALVLAAVVPGYARAGVERLVVSGVIDPAAVGLVREVLAEVADVGIVQIRVADDVLRARLVEGRGWPDDLVERALTEQRELGGAELDARIDVGDESLAEVAERARRFLREPSAVVGKPEAELLAEVTRPLEVSVAVVTGPRAVGKSTIAWELFQRRTATGRRTGFLDLEQLGFAHLPEPARRRLRLENAVAAASTFWAQGAGEVVVNGAVTADEVAFLRAAGEVRVVRLTAAPGDIEERVSMRASGGGPVLGGDDLLGADAEHQQEVVLRSVAEEQRYAEAGIGDLVVSTSRRAVGDVADEIAAWLGD